MPHPGLAWSAGWMSCSAVTAQSGPSWSGQRGQQKNECVQLGHVVGQHERGYRTQNLRKAVRGFYDKSTFISLATGCTRKCCLQKLFADIRTAPISGVGSRCNLSIGQHVATKPNSFDVYIFGCKEHSCDLVQCGTQHKRMF